MALRFKYASNKTAVYDTANGDAPLTAPVSNLPLVKFHSDLDYPRVISEHVVTVNLPGRSNFQAATASYTLFAHGKAGYPFVFGRVNVSGEPVAFTGSIPIQSGHHASISAGYYKRWIALGADATNVYLHEYAVAMWLNGSQYETYDALSIDVTVFVTDEILE